jgi:hypothetical protein
VTRTVLAGSGAQADRGWLGPALAGRQITIWASETTLHVLLEGTRIILRFRGSKGRRSRWPAARHARGQQRSLRRMRTGVRAHGPQMLVTGIAAAAWPSRGSV